MATYTLLDSECFDKDDAKVEIADEQVKQITQTTTIRKVQATIALLNERKAKIEEEIAVNEALIAELQPVVNKAKIVTPITP